MTNNIGGVNGSEPSPLPLEWIGWMPYIWQALAPNYVRCGWCHLAASHTAPVVSLSLSPLSAAISDFSSLDGDRGGALAVWRGCREGDEWLQLWCVAARPLSKQTERFAMCQFLPLNSSFSVSSLFALFAYYLCRAAALDCRIVCQSASQPVSQCYEWVSQSSELVVRCALLGWTAEKAFACHVSGAVITNRC